MKYKIGDKVIIQKGSYWNPKGLMDKWIGKTMTIKDIYFNGYEMIEDSEEDDGAGWYWGEDTIKGLASEPQQSIHIYIKGNETHALLKQDKQTVKESIAKCNPTDEFSLYEGAKLALDRLFDKEVKEIKQSNELKVGSTVKIINKGQIYTTYPEWFKENNCMDIGLFYQYNVYDDNNLSESAIIVAKGKHIDPNSGGMLYAIQDKSKKVYLFGEDGIEKY